LDPRSGVAIEVPADAELAVEFGDMTNMLNLERREALRELGKKYGLSTRQVYDTLERVKKSVG
jgi:hypothetical protein